VLSGVEKLASHASKSTETPATSPGESPPRASAPTPTWSPTSAAAELVNYPTRRRPSEVSVVFGYHPRSLTRR
jgi:hypothetical protein